MSDISRARTTSWHGETKKACNTLVSLILKNEGSTGHKCKEKSFLYILTVKSVFQEFKYATGSATIKDRNPPLVPRRNEPPHDKTNNVAVRPAKTQISLGIRPVWSESSLCTLSVAKDPSYLHADSEDSDQTGRMPRLIWVFAGRTCHFVGFYHEVAQM